MTFNILIADSLNDEGIKPLREASDIHIVEQTNLSRDQLQDIIPSFQALIVRSQTHVTREVIEKATNLKIIGRAGVGVDNIDVAAATEKGIIVVNAPNGNTNSAAEHTMAMLMALSRKIPQAYHALKNKQWDRKRYIGVEVKNKTLGIIGLGRIGTEVAYRASGQRMNILAYDPYLTKEKAAKMGIEYGSLEDVLRKSDFITVHIPLLNETKHLLNRNAFKKMKAGVQIINCARGGIIDEDALFDAIKNKTVAGAALDVFEEEPFLNHRLLELPEVIATPHLGASTIEAQENVAIDVSQDILRFINGELVRNPVNLPSLDKERIRKVEPYFSLAEKLGEFLIYLTDETVEDVSIEYAGNMIKNEVSPISRKIIKGMLARHLGTHVNEINALYLADKRGIHIHERKTSTKKGFSNLITVEMKTKSATRSVSGTLLDGLGPRIVSVDQYSVDVDPQGHIIVIHHTDQPGVIGKMGSLLAKHHVNIATMQVDRLDIGGDAIMLLKVDKHVEKDVLRELVTLEEIHHVRAIDL
ncbi:phosphoglycerate dehydrogenase [Ornithinibacillus contaminans]|uniref:phosphoglycerate dehydrogenase n=1 Tax=Ornithinibacillus contaminans TaxID=694055 RepID=UPI00064DFD17|nr:phosphoglycerate dehydrogenase [Ornithinibacillus contaminans]